MARFAHQFGRRKIHFTDHALDRWWDRCKANEIKGRKEALENLRETLETAEFKASFPKWAVLKLWHQARAEGFIFLGEDAGFVVNKDADGTRVAVTYMEKRKEVAA